MKQHASPSIAGPSRLPDEQLAPVATLRAGPSSLQVEPESFRRPSFHPSSSFPHSALTDRLTRSQADTGQSWIISLSHNVHFSRHAFFAGVKDLAVHPERNSTVILRADPLPPKPTPSIATQTRQINQDDPKGAEKVHSNPIAETFSASDEEAVWLGLSRREEFRLRLMPKQVKRDGKLDQRIAIYESESSPAKHDSTTGQADHGHDAEWGMVMMIPEVKSADEIPFYHPVVSKLAFLYEGVKRDEEETRVAAEGSELAPHIESETTSKGSSLPIRGRIYVAYLPLHSLFTRNSAKRSEPPPGPLNGGGPSGVSTAAEFSRPPNLLLAAARRTPPKRRSPLSQSTSSDTSDTSRVDSEISSSHKPGWSKPMHTASSSAVDQNRLNRTLLALFERVFKHGYNGITPYQKRVTHDVLVQKESFQDLYLELKDRHRHLDSRAPRAGSTTVEDVKRHVWKDVAIAAFLMLLWRDMYPAQESSKSIEGKPWNSWGRPPGGFIDLGCGNGLLVHVLTSEGYSGKGYELRARRTWPLYPPETRSALVELPIDFPSWFPQTVEEWTAGSWPGRDSCAIVSDCFVIGNHADEITPWIPLLSLLPRVPVPYLSLPCCFHTLDDTFNPLNFNPPAHPHSPPGNFAEGLEEGQSRYKAYIMWLGYCGLLCGWEWEKESLRIPSTKGWAIIARRRWTTTDEELLACRQWALEQVDVVRKRGMFKVREREGKDH
ncbi:hypothetical protein BD324DRAFT_389608 [Kockovaella imperatae]|uniref:tRNA (uracil-O(2)-)-methyltransferase n=1 Tax=Kockovaella imperatae TaxID=4999 RepID=A0A1Y1UJJ7_9TREE|nr:hypothetical protein BD324DRAFT_389608 [Kockovaella imperatae]ORX37646.1 hypothetical protein BD324DRAFT_389608 [Kockovaella imperatae]